MTEQERAARVQLVDVALDMLAGRVHLIAGARRITELCTVVGGEDDPLFFPIRAAESDTDHLPVGEAARARCAADWLERADAEMDGYISKARQDILDTCREIVRVCS
jgi:hypothetical protein